MLSIMIALPAHLAQQREAPDIMYLALLRGGIDLLHGACHMNQSLSREKLQSFNVVTYVCRGADKGTPEAPALPPASPLTRGRGQALAQTPAEQDPQQHQPARGGPPTRQSTRIASQAGRRWATPIP